MEAILKSSKADNIFDLFCSLLADMTGQHEIDVFQYERDGEVQNDLSSFTYKTMLFSLHLGNGLKVDKSKSIETIIVDNKVYYLKSIIINRNNVSYRSQILNYSHSLIFIFYMYTVSCPDYQGR
jgi:hypothetical protein